MVAICPRDDDWKALRFIVVGRVNACIQRDSPSMIITPHLFDFSLDWYNVLYSEEFTIL